MTLIIWLTDELHTIKFSAGKMSKGEVKRSIHIDAQTIISLS
jgi:hypothetical protein